MKKLTSDEIKEFVSKPHFDEKLILNKEPSWPKISIVTPSYNQAEFLERTIFSVLNQNYPNLEYIIIDGGSTDGSVEIIKKYEKYLAFWVSEPDNGQADAINKGFLKATGEIVGWLNSDDFYVGRDVVSRVVQATEHSPASIFYGDDFLISKNGKILRFRRAPFPRLQKLLAFSRISQPALFFRSTVIKQERLDESLNYSLDREFWIRLNQKGFQFKYIPMVLAATRLHSQRKMIRGLKESREETKRVLDRNKLGPWSDATFVEHIFDKFVTAYFRTKGLHYMIFHSSEIKERIFTNLLHYPPRKREMILNQMVRNLDKVCDE